MSFLGGIQAETRTWFSADEIAALRLPGLPRDKRQINALARTEQWALKVDADGYPLARKRNQRGGGIEYHIDVLPASARAALAGSDQIIPGPASAGHPIAANDEAGSPEWQWFDRQTDKVKGVAYDRLAAVNAVEALTEAGFNTSAAVAEVAAERGVSQGTLWQWRKLISGIAPIGRLPALAPRRKGGGAEAEMDGEIWNLFKSDYLRPEKPTLSSCYRRVEDIAEQLGVAIPAMKTFQRKLEREVDPIAVIALRDGKEAVRRAMPAQRRTVAGLHAMEHVNIDGHRFDVFVNLGKDAKGKDIILRPTMVAIQDIYSRKFLAWRIGETESAVLTRLAFADLFRNWGIPKACTLDNGRAFASKWISGGAMTRFRFKIREEDPTGLLPALGIKIHWATPYRGQSKPIERGFRDLCDTISRGPECAGAYTGNNPMAKPENYGSRAIPIEQFRSIVAEGIARHNAQRGRRTEMALRSTLDEAFAASYANAPIGKASAEHLRLALLTGENRRVDRQTGQIEMLGNRYWTPELRDHYGQIVTVRFDPDDLHQDIHVYDLSGLYLCSAPVIEDTGFNDVASAKKRQRQEADWRRLSREAVEAEQLLAASEIAKRMPKRVAPEPTQPTVVRPVRHRGGAAAALKVVRTAQPQNDEFMDDFAAGMTRLRIVE